MKTPSTSSISSIDFIGTCESAEIVSNIMPKVTKADYRKVEKLLRDHLDVGFDKSYFLGKKNPYRHRSYKNEEYIVYTHSAIEYFFRYARR